MTTYCSAEYKCSLCGRRTIIIPAGKYKLKKCVYCGHTEIFNPSWCKYRYKRV